MRIKPSLGFTISLLALIFAPVLIPQLGICYFAPYLCVLYYRSSLQKCLWLASVVGLILDCFTSSTHFGVSSLSFVLLTFVMRKATTFLFADKWITLPVMSAVFTLLNACLHNLLTLFFEHHLVWMSLHSLLLSCSATALFSFLFFTLPFLQLSRHKLAEHLE